MLRPNQNQLPGPEGLQYATPHQVNVSSALPDAGLFHVLWRRRWIVLAAVVLAAGGAFAQLRQATPIYSSLSRLYVEQSGPRIINESSGVMTGTSNYLLTQCELLKSTPILNIALEDPEMRRMKTFAGVDNAVAYLKSITDATVAKNSDIISVTVESPYPDEAARLVNSMVDAYVTYQSKQKRSSAAEVLQILKKDKDKSEAELREKFTAVVRFKTENGAFALDNERGNVITEKLGKLSDALTTTQIEVIETRTEYENLKGLMNDPLRVKQLIVEMEAGKESGAPNVQPMESGEAALRAELARQEAFYDDLGRTYGPDHPMMRATREKIDRLTARLAVTAGAEEKEIAETYLGVVERRYEKAQQREVELEKSYSDQERLALSANTVAANYALLNSDLQRTERLCDMLDTRIKELNVTEDVGALNISVLEVGRPGDAPVKPEKAKTMLEALLIGLVAGLGLAFLRDLLDQRIRTAEEITSTTGIAILGVVPRMLGKQLPAACGRKVFLAPQSNIAEAYRTIRTAVYFGMPDPESKTLLMTSPAAGDGKTTSACNLAIAMAQAGQRTLLMDCDFRRPMVHNVFQISNEMGLSSVFAGREALEKAIQPSGVEHLEVLPCGPLPTNPSEILNSRPFAELLAKLAHQYDHVVIDSPPIIPVTDARILAGMCDMTVLVLRAEKSTRKSVRISRDILVGVRARLLGAVVNDLTNKKDGYYYGYYQAAHNLPANASSTDRAARTTEKITVAVARGSRP